MSPHSSPVLAHQAHGREELLSRDSRLWLGRHHEGSLSYMSGRGPRSVRIAYALVDDRIVFRVPDYNDIAHYAPGAQVRLAVAEDDEPVPTVEAGSPIHEIEVVGTAALDSEAGGSPTSPGLDESWPDGIRTSIVTLPLTELRVS